MGLARCVPLRLAHSHHGRILWRVGGGNPKAVRFCSSSFFSLLCRLFLTLTSAALWAGCFGPTLPCRRYSF